MDPITLRPSKTIWMLITVFCLVFVFVGVAMIKEGHLKGWFVLVIFALGFLIGPVHLSTSRLEITDRGFRVVSFKKSHFLNWNEIKDFTVVMIGLNEMVGLNFSEKFSRNEKSRLFVATLTGAEGAFPDTYGLKPQELADLLTKYHQHYV